MQTEPVKVHRRWWCEDSDAAVAHFKERGIEYTEIDIEKDDEAGDWVKYLTGGHHITPTLVYRMHAKVFDLWDEGVFGKWWELANENAGGNT